MSTPEFKQAESSIEDRQLMQERINKFEAELYAMRKDMADIKELLVIFNTSKGFITGMSVIGKVLKWLTIIGGSLVILRKWIFQ